MILQRLGLESLTLIANQVHHHSEKNKIISFCIDDSRPDQYKGVRGKGDVTIHEDVKYTAPIFENIAARYLQADENYLRETRKGDYVILEIKPRYFSTWTIMMGRT